MYHLLSNLQFCHFFVINNLIVYSQPGALDYDFNCDGKVTLDIGINSSSAMCMAIQSDGKIIVAGMTYDVSNGNIFVARYFPDGYLDSSFGTDGTDTIDFYGLWDDVYAIAIQSDDKILILSSSYDQDQYVTFTRLNADGSYDHSIAIQPDGKIVAAGTLNSDFAVVRLNTNGSIDNTFGNLGIVMTDFETNFDLVNSVAILSDGKIVASGMTTPGVGESNFAMARYNSSGILDSTFNYDGKVNTVIAGSYNKSNSMAIQPDGKIILSGTVKPLAFVLVPLATILMVR